MSKPKTIEDLNELYNQAESADKSVFAEQRSNVQLIAGQHYSGKGNKFDRARDSKNLSETQKLRLTKNHIQKITKTYVNNIVEASPGVQITPRNDRDLHHQKAAELNHSVWEYAKDTQKLDLKIIEWAKDYIDLGECFVKVYFDPSKGPFLGYRQSVMDDGTPEVDDQGQPVADESQAVFQGELVIEKVLACNVLREPNAQSMDESDCLIVRKMVPIKTLEAQFGEDPEKKGFIIAGQREEFMTFDMSSNEYSHTKDMALVLEYYWRPSPCYPQGYYHIATKHGILAEDVLPFGVFPIRYVGFDQIQTSPRHRSIVKQLRPWQIEINRTASKIAETQVTSDDKLLVQTGTKLSSGAVLPGVRTVQYNGVTPQILQGRTGEQYGAYLEAQVQELYAVSNVAEETRDRDLQADPYGMLYRSEKEKKKFVIYSFKFELFIKEVCLLYLSLAKNYFNDQMLIPMIGKNEVVNISEFKQTADVQLQIKVMPMSDDLNTMFGRQLSSQHVIQFVGQQLTPSMIGQCMRNMPFGNFEGALDDLTIDDDSATNLLLALERGEQVQPSKADTKEYMIKRIDKRMRQADFKLLAPPIQQSFLQTKAIYEAMVVQDMKDMQAAQQGFIPTGGALTKTDLQVELPNTTGGVKVTRAAFPVEALMWLDEKLKAQGMAQDRLQGELTQSEIANISDRFNQSGTTTGGAGPGMADGPQGPKPGLFGVAQ